MTLRLLAFWTTSYNNKLTVLFYYKKPIKLGVIISDEMVKYNIASRAEFLNQDGIFDPDIF